MKINNANTTPISQPVEATAPAKPAEPVRQEAAPDSALPQLTREEAADRSKARDTAARAQFAQRIEGGAEVAQVSPGDRAKKAQAFVDQIAADPSKAAEKAIEVGRKLDQLSKDIGGMDNSEGLAALSELNDLGIAVQKAQIAVHNKIEFGGDPQQKPGLEHIMQKLRTLDQAVDSAKNF